MKLKILQFECDFDKDDAKIFIPLVLTITSLGFSIFDDRIAIFLAIAYYSFYFYLIKTISITASSYDAVVRKIRMKCPACKSRHIFLQGYQGYKSDELYPYYLCNKCHSTSILIESGLILPN